MNASPVSRRLNVVTGAFGYTGRHVARRLLSMGERVKTLTSRSASESPFGDRVEVEPLAFDDPDALARSLEGAETLYNTYWVRFPLGSTTFDSAVANSRTLIDAAGRAGVRRIVHVSITNASTRSPLPYFRGKAMVEDAVTGSGIEWAIVRPTLVFGEGDVLLNNIAWAARRFPFFPIPGSGLYGVRPVFVGDVAAIAVDAGSRSDNLLVDAVGPETFTFEKLVQLVAERVGARTKTLRFRPAAALFLSRIVGQLVRDEVLTREEIEGLMNGLLVSDGPTTGQTRLSDWLQENAETLGRRYASEIRRHYTSSDSPA